MRGRIAPARKQATFSDNSHPQEQQRSPGRGADPEPIAADALASVIAIDFGRSVKPPPPRRIVVIADCENDTDAVVTSLRFVGVLGKRGKLKAKARGAQIIQTGDLLHKNRPDPTVVGFWEGLRNAAEATDCALHLVAGNHELEIWRRLQSGIPLGLRGSEQQAVRDFVRGMKLFHVEGSMLFIHGYPTVHLLRHMHAYRTDAGRHLNDYNLDCFQAAFDDVNLLARYAYPSRKAQQNSLLYDVPNPERYYRRHGREVASLLDALGIDLVVHGHRPERSGVQRDYELRKLLPGIRMISHDIQLRLQGLGATVIRQTDNRPANLFFVNKKSTTPAHRAVIRRTLCANKGEIESSAKSGKAKTNAPIPSSPRDIDLIAPAIATCGSLGVAS